MSIWNGTFLSSDLADNRKRNAESYRRQVFKRIEDDELVTYSSYANLSSLKNVATCHGVILEEYPDTTSDIWKAYGPRLLICKRISTEEMVNKNKFFFDPAKLVIEDKKITEVIEDIVEG